MEKTITTSDDKVFIINENLFGFFRNMGNETDVKINEHSEIISALIEYANGINTCADKDKFNKDFIEKYEKNGDILSRISSAADIFGFGDLVIITCKKIYEMMRSGSIKSIIPES